MVKSIFKEIIIMLALLATILIILAVLFYDFIPTNKVIPNKVAYIPPENIKAELEEATAEDTLLNIQAKSYTIEGTDLSVYKRNNTYNPNKENPFATVSASGTTTGNISSSESESSARTSTRETNTEKTNTSSEVVAPTRIK